MGGVNFNSKISNLYVNQQKPLLRTETTKTNPLFSETKDVSETRAAEKTKNVDAHDYAANEFRNTMGVSFSAKNLTAVHAANAFEALNTSLAGANFHSTGNPKVDFYMKTKPFIGATQKQLDNPLTFATYLNTDYAS